MANAINCETITADQELALFADLTNGIKAAFEAAKDGSEVELDIPDIGFYDDERGVPSIEGAIYINCDDLANFPTVTAWEFVVEQAENGKVQASNSHEDIVAVDRTGTDFCRTIRFDHEDFARYTKDAAEYAKRVAQLEATVAAFKESIGL